MAIIKKLKKTGGRAVCRSCGWTNSNPANLQANAARHAKQKKHKVIYTLKFTGEYDGRKKKNNEG